MSKVITFSRTFPAYHQKKGQPTYFVEAILTQLGIKYKTGGYYKWLIENNPGISEVFLMTFFDSLRRDISPKSHTIRNHKKPLKVGDFINPKCWAGKPYNKTIEGFWQINFAPEIEIKKVWDFEISKHAVIYVNRKPIYQWCDEYTDKLKTIAQNDGLSTPDLLEWFQYPKEIEGQINCWNENVNY